MYIIICPKVSNLSAQYALYVFFFIFTFWEERVEETCEIKRIQWLPITWLTR